MCIYYVIFEIKHTIKTLACYRHTKYGIKTKWHFSLATGATAQVAMEIDKSLS